MRVLVSIALGAVLAATLSACGDGKTTAVTWTYDEATTLQRTEDVQKAKAKQHLAGLQLVLVIDNGHFVLTQVGGKAPGEYRGSAKSDYNGVRTRTLTKDGQPIPNPDETEVSLRQPNRSQMEMKVDGITITLIRK